MPLWCYHPTRLYIPFPSFFFLPRQSKDCLNVVYQKSVNRISIYENSEQMHSYHLGDMDIFTNMAIIYIYALCLQ